jgi:hypothetical protein
MLGFSSGSLQSVLKDNLKMYLVAVKFTSHLLSKEQKENHVNTWGTFKRGLKET